MAQYEVTAIVDATRQQTVEKKLREAFGKDAEMFSVEKLTTPESRADRLAVAEGMVNEARGIVEELKDEMQDWKDSIPENLQCGNKAEEVDECVSQLEEIQSNLESLEFSVSFPGMF